MGNVTVVGAGIMGSGIAQLAATHGHRVVLRDIDDAALDRGEERIADSLSRFVRKERLSAGEAAEVRARIRRERDLEASVAEADVVIEAVPEVLELKRSVWETVVAAAPGQALLATNTSQLSITRLATAVGAASDRFVGMHFFNPPVMMRLVELVRGLATSDATVDRARAFAEGLEREVVVCAKDSPGFITTRAYAALRMECLRMVEEGLGTPEDIDRALKLAFNLPMGPLELADFNGLDTVLAAMESLHEHFGERFRPTTHLRNTVTAGRLGRKSGAGFYHYDEVAT